MLFSTSQPHRRRPDIKPFNSRWSWPSLFAHLFLLLFYFCQNGVSTYRVILAHTGPRGQPFGDRELPDLSITPKLNSEVGCRRDCCCSWFVDDDYVVCHCCPCPGKIKTSADETCVHLHARACKHAVVRN